MEVNILWGRASVNELVNGVEELEVVGKEVMVVRVVP